MQHRLRNRPLGHDGQAGREVTRPPRERHPLPAFRPGVPFFYICVASAERLHRRQGTVCRNVAGIADFVANGRTDRASRRLARRRIVPLSPPFRGEACSSFFLPLSLPVRQRGYMPFIRDRTLIPSVQELPDYPPSCRYSLPSGNTLSLRLNDHVPLSPPFRGYPLILSPTTIPFCQEIRFLRSLVHTSLYPLESG